VSLRVRSSGDLSEPENYLRKLNQNLPDDIRIIAWTFTDDDFNARYMCVRRTYKYFFHSEGLNLERMKFAAKKLLGDHDYRNFCKLRADIKHYRRSIDRIDIENVSGEIFSFTIVGRAFLWHQVRCVVQILFHIGRGFEEPELIDWLLDVQRVPTRPQYMFASELPLVLYQCDYATELHWNSLVTRDFLGDVHRIERHFFSLYTQKWMEVSMMKMMYGLFMRQIFPQFSSKNYSGEREEYRKIADAVVKRKHHKIMLLPRCQSIETVQSKRKKA